MQILISETRAALKLKLYMPSLISLFAIPDSAGAVEYGLMRNRDRYKLWFDTFVDCDRAAIDGSIAFMARNALLHETSVNWRKEGFKFDRLMIGVPAKPGTIDLRMSGFSMGTAGQEDGNVRAVELDNIAEAILSGAERWLQVASADPDKKARLDGLLQYRPTGLAPFVTGKPVIA